MRDGLAQRCGGLVGGGVTGHLAPSLILVSQLLLRVVFETSGSVSIWVTLIGRPLAAAGCLLGIWVLTRG